LIKNGNLAQNDGLFYVTEKWVGGSLTNFSELSKNFEKLKNIEKQLNDPEERARRTKKEILLLEREKNRLEELYGGIRYMTKKPDALFIIDSHLEDLAVREAGKMGVETVAIVDTNADPFVIDYPIPANDDAVGSIKLISSYILDAWAEGKNKVEKEEKKEVKEEKVKTPKKKEVVKKKERKVKKTAKK